MVCILLLESLCTQPLAAQTGLDLSRTLRIDYLFSGDAQVQEISVGSLSSLKGWAGRRVNMDRCLLRGDADVTLADARTGKVLYRQSFSTLFQEWIQTAEAKRVRRSFENVVLLPMPTDSARVTVRLFSTTDTSVVSYSHTVLPTDILIRSLDALPTPPHRYVHQSGSPDEKIDVAIVAEGYTEEQAEQFYADARTAVEAILSHEPFKHRADCFNFVAVAAASKDSDVSIPKEGLWRNTAVSSHFSTFYSDRYLTTLHLADLHNLLAGIPYEHIIILANTYTYGGGGIYNSYTLTTTHHSAFRPVVVHEFGHSFAGLADEYYYKSPDDDDAFNATVEPWQQNITTLKDFGAKWADLLPEGTVIPTPVDRTQTDRIGVYEGGGCMEHGVFRAFPDCRMRTNECGAFCTVCQRALNELIDFYVGN